jgi:hypothetical protein
MDSATSWKLKQAGSQTPPAPQARPHTVRLSLDSNPATAQKVLALITAARKDAPKRDRMVPNPDLQQQIAKIEELIRPALLSTMAPSSNLRVHPVPVHPNPIVAPVGGNLTGTWVALRPMDSTLPSKLVLNQVGNQVSFMGRQFQLSGSTASRTAPQGCAPAFQRPGVNYGPSEVAGTITHQITLQGSVLTYEMDVTWKAPCDGHSIGTERHVSRYQRSQVP